GTPVLCALLGAVPARVCAANHDTSVVQLERTYSKYIADHSDAVARHALLDLASPAGAKVVPLSRRSGARRGRSARKRPKSSGSWVRIGGPAGRQWPIGASIEGRSADCG